MNVKANDLKSIDYSQATQEAISLKKDQGNQDFTKLVKSYLKEVKTNNVEATTSGVSDPNTAEANSVNKLERQGSTDAVNNYLKNLAMDKTKTNNTTTLSPIDNFGVIEDGEKTEETTAQDLMGMLQGLLNTLNEIVSNNAKETSGSLNSTTITEKTDVALITTKTDLNLLLKELNSFLKLVENTAMDNIKLLQGELKIKGTPEQLLNSLEALTQTVNQPSVTNSKLDDEGSQKLLKLLLSNLNTVKSTEELRVQLSSKTGNDDGIKKALSELLSTIEETDTQSSKVDATVLGKNVDNIKAFQNKIVELLTVLSKGEVEMKELPQSLKADPDQKLIKLLDNVINKETSETNPKVKEDDSTEINKDSIQSQSYSNKDSLNVKITKEDKLLKNVLGEEVDTKINKVNVFMSQIKSENDKLNQIQPPEKLVIDKSNLTQDIVKVVKYMNLNDMKELTVKITPKELGDIVIKITMEAGNMKANISAQNKDTYNLLSSRLEALTNALNNNDIKIQNVDINIYQEDSTYFNDGFNEGRQRENNQRGTRSGAKAGNDTIESPVEATEPDNNISILV